MATTKVCLHFLCRPRPYVNLFFYASMEAVRLVNSCSQFIGLNDCFYKSNLLRYQTQRVNQSEGRLWTLVASVAPGMVFQGRWYCSAVQQSIHSARSTHNRRISIVTDVSSALVVCSSTFARWGQDCPGKHRFVWIDGSGSCCQMSFLV